MRLPFITAMELNHMAKGIEAVINLKHMGGHVSVCAGRGQKTLSIMFMVTGLQMANSVWLKARVNLWDVIFTKV